MHVRLMAVFFVGVAIVNPFPALCQSSAGKKDTIFIGAVKVSESVRSSASKKGRSSALALVEDGLRSQLVTSLNQTRVFQLIERERKGEIELEQAYSEVAVDPNDTDRAQTMKMLGAKYTFLPRIDGFEDTTTTTRYEAIGRSSMSRSVWISATVQITDTSTGAILPDSPSVKVTSGDSAKLVQGGARLGGEELINSLTAELARRLSQEAVSLLRPPKVLVVTGQEALINRGIPAGLTDGVEVEFFASEDIIDEDTGESFRNEISVGKGRIKTSDNKKSRAVIQGENLGVAKGCIVRPIKKAKRPVQTAKKKTNPAPVSAGSSDKPIVF